MEIVVSQAQGEVPVTVFYLKGRVNLGTAYELEEKAQEAYKNGTRHLLIDLAGVESLTSAGLRALLAIYKLLAGETAAEGKEAVKSPYLKLLNPPPFIHRVLNTSGFDRFIEVYDDPQLAVASFG